MLSNTGGGIWGRIPKSLRFSVTPRVRVAAFGVAVGIALLSLLRYLRRNKSSSLKEPLPDLVARAVSPPGPSLKHDTARHGGRLPRRNSMSFSTSDSATTETLVHYGMENLQDAIKQWERALLAYETRTNKAPSEEDLFSSLDEVLHKSKDILSDLKRLVSQYSLELPDNISVTSLSTLTQGGATGGVSLAGYEHVSAYRLGGRKTMSILSDDSWQSALEDLIPTFEDIDILGRDPLNLDISELLYYHDGLREARKGNVRCRVVRTEFLHCASDEDFFAKLWCIRNALNKLLMEEWRRDWMMDAGRTVIGDLMKQANKDPENFYGAYDKMMRYLEKREIHLNIEEELKGRKVPCFTFFDVVLDFILMDSFDDLASPPSAVLAVAQNRLLSAGFKESTLSTVVWSVLKAKRARLQVPDGFISHFYDISEQVSPTMAWGFLGTNEHLRELCYFFKDQICSFLTDIFCVDRVRYTSLADLTEDIWLICQTRAEMSKHRLSTEIL